MQLYARRNECPVRRTADGTDYMSLPSDQQAAESPVTQADSAHFPQARGRSVSHAIPGILPDPASSLPANAIDSQYSHSYQPPRPSCFWGPLMKTFLRSVRVALSFAY
jgi:hypothetical protein